MRGRWRRISACMRHRPRSNVRKGDHCKAKYRTLSISAMMGMRNRASRSRSLTRLLTNATSCALGRPCSVKMVSTRSASDSLPGGNVRSSVRSFPCVDPSARMSGVMSCWMVSCTETSMPPYAANILIQVLDTAHVSEYGCLTRLRILAAWSTARTRAPGAAGSVSQQPAAPTVLANMAFG